MGHFSLQSILWLQSRSASPLLCSGAPSFSWSLVPLPSFPSFPAFLLPFSFFLVPPSSFPYFLSSSGSSLSVGFFSLFLFPALLFLSFLPLCIFPAHLGWFGPPVWVIILCSRLSHPVNVGLASVIGAGLSPDPCHGDWVPSTLLSPGPFSSVSFGLLFSFSFSLYLPFPSSPWIFPFPGSWLTHCHKKIWT